MITITEMFGKFHH